MFFSFSNSFFIWLSICFCLLILFFFYLLFVLISQLFVTFYIWLLVLLYSIFYLLRFLVSSICKCVICSNRKKNKIWLGEIKSIFTCMDTPVWLFSKSKIKISQLKKRLFDFLKIMLDFFSNFTFFF